MADSDQMKNVARCKRDFRFTGQKHIYATAKKGGVALM